MKSDKAIPMRNGKRDLFAELKEGIDALADARDGKQTLRTHDIQIKRTLTGDESP